MESLISDLVEDNIRRATVKNVETLEENQSYSIELEDDDELYFVEIIATDEEFPLAPCVEAYINNRTTIPVDTVLASGTRELEAEEYAFYVSRLAPGDGLDSFEALDDQTRENLYIKIGEYLGQLHNNFELSSYGPLTGYEDLSVQPVNSRLSEFDNYYSIATEAMDIHSVELNHLEPEIEDFFETHKNNLTDSEPSFTHPCLTSENIVVDSGYTITALNGWEHTQSGTPIENLIQTQILLVNSKFDDEDKIHKYRNALYMGYQRQHPLPDNFSEIYEMYYTIALFHLLTQHAAIDCSVDFLVSELEPRLGEEFETVDETEEDSTDDSESEVEETDADKSEDEEDEDEDTLFDDDMFEDEESDADEETEEEDEESESEEKDSVDQTEDSESDEDEDAETDEEWFETFGDFEEDEFEIDDEDVEEEGEEETENVEVDEEETEKETEEGTDDEDDLFTDMDESDEEEGDDEGDGDKEPEDETHEGSEEESVDEFFSDMDDSEESEGGNDETDEDGKESEEDEPIQEESDADEDTEEDEENAETDNKMTEEENEESADEFFSDMDDTEESDADKETDEDSNEAGKDTDNEEDEEESEDTWESDDDWEF